MTGLNSLAIISFKTYKSFNSNGPFNIKTDKNITLIIGRNNCGKSSLVDVIESSINYANGQKLTQNIMDLNHSYNLDQAMIENSFSKDVSRGGMGREREFGMRFLGQFITVEPGAKEEYTCASLEKQISIKSTDFLNGESNWKSVALRISRSLNQKAALRRVNAERDIVPEIEDDDETVYDNGVGATNLVRKFINTDTYQEMIVEKQILSELNKIMEPDAHFNSIRIQQVGNKTESGYKWEVFLEENEHRYALSRSGSGLKTILLILINLYLIPKTKGYSDKSIWYAFEEIENNLHPALQRRIFEYLYEYSVKSDARIFIMTHSHIAINTFYGKDEARLYHVTKENGNSELIEITSGALRTEILDDLDVKASDLFQTNGIIWVEGPSDRIYILKWLRVFTDFDYIEGQHFQFMYYGGRLLSHYEAEDAEEKTDGLINILTTNRNAAIVIDSDKKNRQTSINETKKRIKEEFERKGYFCWITKGKEIENYISEEAVNLAHNSKLPQIDQYELFPEYIKKYDANFSSHKVESARKMSGYITNENSSNILDLKAQIEKLYGEIRKWN